jgi:hypothetical protein
MEKEQFQSRLASLGRDPEVATKVISLLEEKDERIKVMKDSQTIPMFPLTE